MNRRRVIIWFGANLILGMCHPAIAEWVPLGGLLESLAVNAVLFLIPGLGWANALRIQPRRLGMRTLVYLLFSSGVFVLVLLLAQIIGVATSQGAITLMLIIATNLGFAASALRRIDAPRRRTLLSREWALGTAVFATSYLAFFWGATYLVPPQLDHDLEIQGTGYSLVERFEPMLLTDRGGLHYFAHPPLLHLYVAESFLMYGDIDQLLFYEDITLAARARRDGESVAAPKDEVRMFGRDGTYRIVDRDDGYYVLEPSEGGEAIRVTENRLDASRIIFGYLENPSRQQTRTPNVFFAALTVALLAVWAGRLSHCMWLGLLVAIAYASNPEVFVRSSYGGYFAIGGLLTIFSFIASDRSRNARYPFISGLLAGLTDHKLIFLPFAYCVQLGINWLRRAGLSALSAIYRPRVLRVLVHPVALGFALGTALFWIFGLSVSPAEFYQDHIRQHLVDRVAHINSLGYGGYLSPTGLWREFSQHTGYVIFPAALTLLGIDIWRDRARDLNTGSSLRELLLLYIVVTALAFTAIDWRMTKHLSPILLPIFLALVPGRRAPRWRVILPGFILLYTLVYNFNELMHLMQDFHSFRITPDW